MSAVPVSLAMPMSDTTTHPAHSPHAAHPDSQRLRAVSLWCEGQRSPAIARQLDVPERTVRAWLAEARADFQVEQGATAQEVIALAVQRQLAIAAAAWASYHRAVALDELALDYHRAQAQQAHDEARALPPPPPRPSTSPARYLSVALAAQREAARLSGCYDHAKAAAQAAAWQERNPPPQPLTYAQTRGLDPADQPAWDAFLRKVDLSPARFAGPADLDQFYRPAWEAFCRRVRARLASQTPIPARTATANPAESATAVAPNGGQPEPANPAESATAPLGMGSAAPSTPCAGSGVAAELQPTEPSRLPIPAESATAPLAPLNGAGG